jgi:hypothetical protein
MQRPTAAGYRRSGLHPRVRGQVGHGHGKALHVPGNALVPVANTSSFIGCHLQRNVTWLHASHKRLHWHVLRCGDASSGGRRVNLLAGANVKDMRRAVCPARQQPCAVSVPLHLGHSLLVVAQRQQQAALLRDARVPQLDLQALRRDGNMGFLVVI